MLSHTLDEREDETERMTKEISGQEQEKKVTATVG